MRWHTVKPDGDCAKRVGDVWVARMKDRGVVQGLEPRRDWSKLALRSTTTFKRNNNRIRFHHRKVQKTSQLRLKNGQREWFDSVKSCGRVASSMSQFRPSMWSLPECGDSATHAVWTVGSSYESSPRSFHNPKKLISTFVE